MGSDMYMAMQNWRPGPNKVEWLDPETIKVQTDSFDGYRTIYEGKVTPEVDTLLKGLNVRLPERNPIVVYAMVQAEFVVRGRANGVTPETEDEITYAIARRLRAVYNLLKKDFPNLDIEVR